MTMWFEQKQSLYDAFPVLRPSGEAVPEKNLDDDNVVDHKQAIHANCSDSFHVVEPSNEKSYAIRYKIFLDSCNKMLNSTRRGQAGELPLPEMMTYEES